MDYVQSQQLLKSARDATLEARPGILAANPASPLNYPIFAESGKGAFVFDVDGRKYLDFILAFGAVVLGHAQDDIDDAVIAEIRKGVSPTLHTRTQIELANLVCDIIPGAERVIFLRTGSDATSAAVRIARAHTKRRHVFRWGYNGWHDWCAPRAAGVLPATREATSTFDYHDLRSLKSALAEKRGDVAAVIMMPVEVDDPPPGHLQEIANLTRQAGALFILDEVRSGFRLGLGGAQRHFGVDADLAVFSKAMANGYCISAVTGPARILQSVGEVSLSSLFFRSSDGMAAALATIKQLASTDAIAWLWRLGARFQEELTRVAASTGVAAVSIGLPPMPFLKFEADAATANEAMRIFVDEMLHRGVLLHPSHHWFVCAAMTDADIDFAIAQSEASFTRVAEELGDRIRT